MSSLLIFLELGYDHIIDINGLDHVLFVIAICTTYTLYDWKRVLILITAFTIGHSLTLALAVLDIMSIDSTLVEFLIPITILITAITNMFNTQNSISKNKSRAMYVMALVFGLIHGLGFSNYLKTLMGRNSDIVGQLFGFNIGLELGQLIIVLSFLMISFIFTELLRINRRDFKLAFSSAIAGISIMLIIQNPFLNN